MIRITKHNKPVDLPEGWDAACSKGVELVGGDMLTIKRGADNRVVIDFNAAYTDMDMAYQIWLSSKNNAMLYGGSGDGYSFDLGYRALMQERYSTAVRYIQDTAPMDDGAMYLIGSREVGVDVSDKGEIKIGIPSTTQINDQIAERLDDCQKCCWVLYHALNDIIYRCFKYYPSKHIFGLLDSYQAMCARWNLVVWSKAARLSITNNKSSLSVLVGYTCVDCEKDPQTITISFDTPSELEPATGESTDTDEEDAPKDAPKDICTMAGELVPYIAPVSTNISKLEDREPRIHITKVGSDSTTSTGLGDDRVYEYIPGTDTYMAYNNWTNITVTIELPKLYRGERIAYLVQLIRGARSMTGRVLAPVDSGININVNVDVNGFGRHINETHALLGYITPEKRDDYIKEEDEEETED